MTATRSHLAALAAGEHKRIDRLKLSPPLSKVMGRVRYFPAWAPAEELWITLRTPDAEARPSAGAWCKRLDRSSIHEVISMRAVAFASLLLLALSFGVAACNRSSSAGVSEVSEKEVLGLPEKAEGPVLVDVRAPSEFASGHVPQAINIPVDQVAERLTELAPHKERGVILYCERGGRALKAATILLSAGFPNVGHLQGDMSGWRAAGLPIER